MEWFHLWSWMAGRWNTGYSMSWNISPYWEVSFFSLLPAVAIQSRLHDLYIRTGDEIVVHNDVKCIFQSRRHCMARVWCIVIHCSIILEKVCSLSQWLTCWMSFWNLFAMQGEPWVQASMNLSLNEFISKVWLGWTWLNCWTTNIFREVAQFRGIRDLWIQSLLQRWWKQNFLSLETWPGWSMCEVPCCYGLWRLLPYNWHFFTLEAPQRITRISALAIYM